MHTVIALQCDAVYIFSVYATFDGIYGRGLRAAAMAVSGGSKDIYSPVCGVLFCILCRLQCYDPPQPPKWFCNQLRAAGIYGFYFFIFFCTYSSLEEETKNETLKLLSWMVVVFSSAVALVSLGMMLADYCTEIDHLGTKLTIGFIHRNSSMQLVGATTGPSSLSELCMMGMISAWYLFHKPNGMPKWPCTLAGIILFFTIAAANAYSALMSMTAFAGAFGALPEPWKSPAPKWENHSPRRENCGADCTCLRDRYRRLLRSSAAGDDCCQWRAADHL